MQPTPWTCPSLRHVLPGFHVTSLLSGPFFLAKPPSAHAFDDGSLKVLAPLSHYIRFPGGGGFYPYHDSHYNQYVDDSQPSVFKSDHSPELQTHRSNSLFRYLHLMPRATNIILLKTKIIFYPTYSPSHPTYLSKKNHHLSSCSSQKPGNLILLISSPKSLKKFPFLHPWATWFSHLDCCNCLTGFPII